MGRLEDPVTYAQILALIDARDHALVVDPFLPAPEMASLLLLPKVERILTKKTPLSGRNKQDAATRTTRLQIELGTNPDVELRFLPREYKELHDRLVLPSSGQGLIIGTSLGGTQLTVATNLSVDTTTHLRAHYEELWALSEQVKPIGRGDDSNDGGSVGEPAQNGAESSGAEAP